jgi:hypothetical protein
MVSVVVTVDCILQQFHKDQIVLGYYTTLGVLPATPPHTL